MTGYAAMLKHSNKSHTVVLTLDLNAKDEHGETPLHWAVTCEKLEVIELLINKGADANVLSSSLDSPLHTAVRLQNSDTVRVS